MANEKIHITLLGEFGLFLPDQTALSLTGERPISLLAYLLLHRHTPQPRQQIAFSLWPDSSDSQARANLRNLLFTLRQTLPHADDYLIADSLTLQWRPNADFSLDVADFQAALTAVRTAASPQAQITHLETAVNLYKGDLLPNNYDDWIIPRREELRQDYLAALRQLAALLEEQADYRAAHRTMQRLLQLDPLDETVYVQIMRLQALSGDRAGVRRTYDQCQAILRRELDVEPGPATTAAYQQLLRLETPATAVSLPTPPTPPAPSRPLPTPATPFIGREAELAEIAELLADPACRLLTIVGPGGMGKTRLALETAVGHQPIFADGVAWVALNTLQTPNQVAAALAEALRYRLSGAEAEAELIHVLAQKEILLVLDNFEHLLAAADFLTQLLAQTTAVKLLVTSRQALELPAEWRFDLGEFPLPDETQPETLADNSAVRLFLHSARRTAAAQQLTAIDYPAIARICRLVDGIPLGIELAASWTRLLSCQEIAREITQSLDFLTVNLRHVPPRHRSLRAVFDYSWDLLSAAEKQTLGRLAVFSGGFTREAAEQVAAADLSLLSGLVDRSLVQRPAVGRFSLHNIVRQYTGERLPLEDDTVRRHSAYYLQWLENLTTALQGKGQPEALTAVSHDISNIRAAWQYAVGARQLHLLRGASFTLFYFYELRGLIHEGETVFRTAAAALQGSANPTPAETCAIGELLTHWSYLAFREGQITLVMDTLRQVTAELETLPDSAVLSFSWRYLGLVLAANGRFAEAAELLTRSFDLAARHDKRWEMAITQAYQGMILYDLGHLAEAEDMLDRACAASQTLGDPRLIAFSLMLLGRTNLRLGQWAEASQQLEESQTIARYAADSYMINTSRLYLAQARQAGGDLAAAREMLQASIDSFSLTDDLVGAERASLYMGLLESATGHADQARAYFMATLQAQNREHNQKYILGAIVGLAGLLAQAGEPETALTWVTAVLHQPGLDWETDQLAAPLRTNLETRLPPETIAAADSQAAQLSFAALQAAVLAHLSSPMSSQF